MEVAALGEFGLWVGMSRDLPKHILSILAQAPARPLSVCGIRILAISQGFVRPSLHGLKLPEWLLGAVVPWSKTQAHLVLNCLVAVRSICHPDQRRHSISAAVRH